MTCNLEISCRRNNLMDRTATIFGGGFGLYGYIAALKVTGFSNFIVSVRHKDLMQSRKNLSGHMKDCYFAKDVDMLSTPSELVVFAVNPKKQEDLINDFILQTPEKILLLEKPLGVDPAVSSRLASALESTGINYNCNYTFFYTSWFQNILIQNSEFETIQISWSFRAHHFVNNLDTWKRVPSEGGGIIRFYGTHLIYIASVLGFFNVIESDVKVNSSGDEIYWSCILKDRNQRRLLINLNTFALKNIFQIQCDKNYILELEDPFDVDAPEDVMLDRRHELIKRHILLSLGSNSGAHYADAHQVISLW